MAKRSDGIEKCEDIDEQEFLKILDGRSNPSALPSKEKQEERRKETEPEMEPGPEKEERDTAVPKRTNKKKKNSEYISAFLKPRVLKQRQSVYISQNIHEFISKIVNKLGIRNMTVGVFIDTVMAQHIIEHKEDLASIYYKEEGNIFKKIEDEED